MDKTLSPLQFTILDKPKITTYNFMSVRLTRSPDGKFINKQHGTVQKEFIKRDQNGLMFSVKILDKKQSGQEDILEFEEALEFLEKEIILYTNSNGEIQSILNKPIIKEAWEDKIPGIKKRFKKEVPNIHELLEGINELLENEIDFLRFIKKSDIYSLLFPPVFDIGLLNKKSVAQQKIFPDFFEHCAIPIELESRIEALNVLTKGLQVIRKGKLDTHFFDEDAAAAFLFNSYGVHKSNLNFDATYLEYYDLDNENNIDKVNGIFSVEVPNVFSYRQINKLIQKS